MNGDVGEGRLRVNLEAWVYGRDLRGFRGADQRKAWKSRQKTRGLDSFDDQPGGQRRAWRRQMVLVEKEFVRR